MASVLEVGGSWRVQIRRKGQRSFSQTFATEGCAWEWAEKIEAELAQGGRIAHLATAVDEYIRDHSDMGRTKLNVLGHLKAGLGGIILNNLSVADVKGYVIKRGYGPATAQAEVSIL